MASSTKYQPRFGHSITDKILLIALSCFVLVSLFAEFLANDRPLYAQIDGKHYWPAVQALLRPTTDDEQQWGSGADRLVLAPIPFSTNPSAGIHNRYQPPLTTHTVYGRKKKHWLGTDRLGRDVAACMVYGCRKSVYVGLFSMLLAALIGIFSGLMAGYWGNNYQMPRPWVFVVVSTGILYIGFLYHHHLLRGPLSVLIVLVLLAVGHQVAFRNGTGRRVRAPMDDLVLKAIELFNSVPTLMLLLAITSIFVQPGLTQLALIIGLISWTSFARFTRAEVLNTKELAYVKAAKISGQNHVSVIWTYILPAILGPLLVTFAFGVASVILLESTLSFLGIGVPPEEVTWGSLLGQSKRYTQAWWLAIFPGITIFVVITVLHMLGDRLKRKLDPED